MAQEIKSGWFIAPAGKPLTPTGAAKKSECDNPYLTKDEYIQSAEAIGAGITATSSDGLYASGGLDKIILRASAWVSKYCRRWFDTQSIDEYQTGFTVKPFNPRLVTVYTRNSPIQTISGIWIQVLQWFIQVQTTPLQQSYLQIQPDWGTFKIVPLLSTAGSGTGSPIPAAILNKVPLGVLWYSYTFGYGQSIAGYILSNIPDGNSTYTIFQAADYDHQLWAPDQTINVYIDGALQVSSSYLINHPNGIVTFNSDIGTGHTVTGDFITNNSVPADIKYCVVKLATKFILDGLQNPARFASMNITGYSVTFGGYDDIMKEIKEVLQPYKRNQICII